MSSPLPELFGGTPPPLFLQQNYTIRSYECGGDFTLSPLSLLNYLQEIAGVHANQIGVGIGGLQEKGLTWVLVRMHLAIQAPLPRWGTSLLVTTWPSGARGALAATRDFHVAASDGKTLAEANSEWLILNRETLRPVRLPPDILSLAPHDTPRVQLPQKPAIQVNGAPIGQAIFPVRHTDLDQNNHVNNVHYSEWAFESLPTEWRGRILNGLQVTFKDSAHWGDVISSETSIAGTGTLLHRVADAKDPNRLFAEVVSIWSE